LQEAKAKLASVSSTISAEDKEPVDKGTLEVVVSEPQRIGDGMSSYIVYKVHTKVLVPVWTQCEHM
jgi:hypothetical protein